MSSRRTVFVRKFILFCFLACCSSSVWARSYSIDSFHSDIAVHRDSHITIHEQIAFRFNGAFQGVYRFIPVTYRAPWGINYALHIKLRGATLENGIAPKTKLSREGRYWRVTVFVPNAADTVRTVELTYDVWRAVRPFRDHDELYWNVTGNEWDVPIAMTSANVSFDADAAPSDIKSTAYSGGYGSTRQDVAINNDGKTVLFTLPTQLNYREGMTIVVGWPQGKIDYPSRIMDIIWFVQDNPVVFIPILVLIICFLVWYKLGRDPAMGSVAPEYAPPPDLSAAEMGTLIDDSADTRDVCAMVVDLAVRGYIRIEEVETAVDGKDFFFKQTKEFKDDATLRPFEKYLLSVLFRVSDSRMLYEMKNYFYEDLNELKREIDGYLIERGYYLNSPAGIRAAGTVTALAAAAIGFIWALRTQSLLIFICMMVSAIGIGVFGYFMPRKTPRGVDALRKTLGFQEYLRRAEKDRIQREPPDVFHKWLPYAMALGVLEQWTKTFEGLTVPAPAWYSSKHAFNPVYFGQRISLMSMSMGNVFSSQPRQSGGRGWSGGSGFGGGGFSGGGFGGGGGGAF